MNRKNFFIAANVLVIAVSAYFIWLQGVSELMLYRLCKEDRLLENLQVIFLLIASIVFIELAFKGHYSKYWLIALGLFLFVVAGEEISWGQRAFGVITPENWAQNNVQMETNLHNLKWVQRHVRSLGLLFVTTICWAIPLANRFLKPAASLFNKTAFPVFPLGAASIMTIAVGFMIAARFDPSGRPIYNYDEIGELWMAFAFLVFAAGERISVHTASFRK